MKFKFVIIANIFKFCDFLFMNSNFLTKIKCYWFDDCLMTYTVVQHLYFAIVQHLYNLKNFLHEFEFASLFVLFFLFIFTLAIVE